MKDKLILFDWGNIVESHTIGYTYKDAYNDLFKACGYKEKEDIYPKLSKYKLTVIPTVKDFEHVYNKIVSDFNLKTTYKEFIDLYKKIFDKIDYHKNVSEYEKSLKDKCYIGIISNLTVFDKERLNKQVDLSKYDYLFLSFEMKCRKPEKEFYNIVNNEIPFNKEDILFIDDKQANIDMAKEFGWNTLKATGLELDKIKTYCEDFIKVAKV